MWRRFRKSTVMFAVVLCPILSATVGARPFDTMPVCSQAEVKALRFITVGRASLHRPDCNTTSPLSAPLRLDFTYYREIPGDAFAKAARKIIRRNLPAVAFKRLASRIDAFNAAYQTIQEGDRYSLDYHADGTLVLLLNGEAVAREKGDDFASAYLSIWFGERPYSDALKAALMDVGS